MKRGYNISGWLLLVAIVCMSANTLVRIGQINATGTPSSTTFLCGNGTWATPLAASQTPQTLTISAGASTWNINSGYNAKITLTANTTVTITNAADGQYGTIVVYQDGTGGRTLSLPNNSITVSSVAGDSTTLTFYYRNFIYEWVGGSTNTVANGKTGGTSFTAYALLAGGTISTGNLQALTTGTSGQILRSGGSAALPSYSTATYPATAGTSGNVLTSDGTNITSSANTGGWTTLHVSGSDATTTGQSLVDITGLVSGTLTNSTMYEVEAVLLVTTSAVLTGNEYGIFGGGTGSAATCNAILTGTTTATVATSQTINTIATASSAVLTASGITGTIIIKGNVTTRSTGTATISLQHLKVTSGTSTVKIGSVFRYRLAS